MNLLGCGRNLKFYDLPFATTLASKDRAACVERETRLDFYVDVATAAGNLIKTTFAL